jgi:hypothetical protein
MTERIRLDNQTVDGTLTPSKISTNPLDNFTFPGNVTIAGAVSAASGTGGGAIAEIKLTGQNADINGIADNNTQSKQFAVFEIIDSTHLRVDSTLGFSNGDSIAQDGLYGTTITTVLDATHLEVGDTTGWVVAPILFVPAVTGLYQISLYAVGTGTDAGSDPTCQVSYMDNWGPQYKAIASVATTPGQTSQFSIIIEAIAGQPVCYSVTGGTFDAGAIYSLYLSASGASMLSGTNAEVASISLSNQSSVPSGSTVLFTPTESGLYALKMYMVGTLVGGAGSSFLGIQFSFNDGLQTEFAQGGNQINVSGIAVTDALVSMSQSGILTTFYVAAGQPVEYSLDGTIAAGGTPTTLVGGDIFSLYLKIFKVDAAGGSTLPAGDDRTFQFNDNGKFGSAADFRFYSGQLELTDPTGAHNGAGLLLGSDIRATIYFMDNSGSSERARVRHDNSNFIIKENVGDILLDIQSGGSLNLSSHFITNVLDPVNPQDAATKNYVDGSKPEVVQSTSTGGTIISSTSFSPTGITATITPSSTSSRVKITIIFECNLAVGLEGYTTIYNTTTNTELSGSANGLFITNTSGGSPFNGTAIVVFVDSPNTNSPVTYELYARTGDGSNIGIGQGGVVNVVLLEEIL